MASDTMQVTSFHLDVASHPQEPAMQLALQELHFFAKEVRVMGTYAAHPFRKSNLIIEE